jgi:hypothetical protein
MTMRMRLVVVLAFALAGCETGVVTGSSREAVIIKYDPALSKRDGKIQQMADKECAAYGMKARYVSTNELAPMAMRHDRFACEPG